MYKIERWTERGITTAEAKTKAEANHIAKLMRDDNQTFQTAVIFPNGTVRFCRAVRKASS